MLWTTEENISADQLFETIQERSKNRSVELGEQNTVTVALSFLLNLSRALQSIHGRSPNWCYERQRKIFRLINFSKRSFHPLWWWWWWYSWHLLSRQWSNGLDKTNWEVLDHWPREGNDNYRDHVHNIGRPLICKPTVFASDSRLVVFPSAFVYFKLNNFPTTRMKRSQQGWKK